MNNSNLSGSIWKIPLPMFMIGMVFLMPVVISSVIVPTPSSFMSASCVLSVYAMACSAVVGFKAIRRAVFGPMDQIKAELVQLRRAYKEVLVVLDSSERRRVRLAYGGGSYTNEEWESLKHDYNYTCLRCGKREPEIVLSPDHVYPVALGGSSFITNIQPLCRACNLAKKDTYADYRPSEKS